MSSVGTGYDLQASTFSPDGRIFQVEYAQKAVDNGGTALGIVGKDGVVLAVEKPLASKLLKADSQPRIATLDSHIGCAGGGMYVDCRALLDYGRDEALEYRRDCKTLIPIDLAAQKMADYAHMFTLTDNRPFGCSLFLTSYSEKTGGRLFLVEPSGMFYQYRAWAIGKYRQAAKTEIEKLQLSELTCEQLVKEAAKILLTVRDENKEKGFKIELSWICAATAGKHRLLSEEKATETVAWAREKIEQEADMED